MPAFSPTATPTGVRFAIHVQPRAKRPGVGGLHGDALKVRVGAAPVDGAANEAVVAAIAAALGLPRRDVAIVSGHSSRSKLVSVVGVTVDAVRALAGKDG